VTGLQKKIEVDDDKKIRPFFDRRMGQELDGEVLGDEYKGYIFKITGGNDKQGFPMKQGVLVNGRVRLLLKKKTSTYRPKRTGERKRKSVRGCICGPDLAVIALKIVKKGEADMEGVTTDNKPRRLGPKRASYIRKVFALRKQDDVRKYVVRREVKKGDKTFYKSPKIQRLVTEKRIRRKKLVKKAKIDGFKKSKDLKAKYDKVLSKYIKERKSHHAAVAATAVAAPVKEEPKKVEVAAPKKAVAKK
jgi:small subunit ribosomal protein S6e